MGKPQILWIFQMGDDYFSIYPLPQRPKDKVNSPVTPQLWLECVNINTLSWIERTIHLQQEMTTDVFA